MSGTLYITATPIGNMEDITLRAVRVLREADVVCAEDTRHTGLLLKKLGITNRLLSLHEFSDTARVEEVVALLREGRSIALVSDAGTPIISDPGAYLVRRALEAGAAVTPVPGACAAIAAYCASGMEGGGFTFIGFLEKSGGARREQLAYIISSARPCIVYESPKRIAGTLADIAAIDPNRGCCVARELTKLYEQFVRGTARELAERYASDEPKGEIALVVAAAAPNEADDETITAELKKRLATGVSKKDAAAEVTRELGANKNRVKKLSLELNSL